MSYEEKAAGSSDVYFGIEWNESSSGTTFSIVPTIYRWDSASTDNYGSAFSETLSPDPSGSGSWSGLSYPSGSGYRTIDTFGTRTYNRGHSDSTITYVIYTDSEFGTWNGYWQSIGALSRTFTITVPRKASYSVTFNANGGSGAPSAQTKWYGETLTLSSTKPTRTGYTFAGWNTKADGTGTNYASGGSYTGNANLTLYAKWSIVTYAVSFNANGGSGAPAAQTKTYGKTLTLTTAKPTRTGYTFSKWNTKSDGTGTSYNSGGSYTANAAATLYAIWTINTYTITYNANGGSGTTAPTPKNYGASVNLRANGFSKTGYYFSKWNTKADGTGTSYNAGAAYTANASVTLYAYWLGNKYYVAFNANGGSGTMNQQEHTYGSSAKLTSNAFSRSYVVTFNYNGSGATNTTSTADYSFKNWNTKADGSGTAYANKASVSNLTSTSGATVNLYAQWTSASVTLPTPTWQGHTFAGWYTASSGGTKVGNGGASYTPTAAITLYAHWTTNTYTIAYNANGGSGAPASQTKTYGENLPLSSTKPTRSQYNFTAWNTKADGSGTSYQPGATYTANSAATLYAIWTVAHAAPTISSLSVIRCDSNGDADDEGTRCKVTVKWAVDASDTSQGTNISAVIGTGSGSTTSVTISGKSGTTSFIHGKSNLLVENSYAVTVTVTDTMGSTGTKTAALSQAFFTMDFFAGGHGVAIGKPATTADLLDIGMPIRANMPIYASKPIMLGTNTTAEENGIKVKGGGDRTAWLLRNISASNNGGDAVLLGNGGATIVGAGEAHNGLWSELGISAGTEQLHLGADGNVYIWSNCQDITHRARAVFTTTDSGTYPQTLAIEGGQASSIAVSNNANNGWTTTNANGTYSSMQLRDKNGYWTGVWGSYVVGSTTAASHGANCMYIGARNKTTPTTENPNGTDVANYINLYVRKDGTRTVSVSDAGAWRTALGVPGLATANTFTAAQVIKDGSINRDGSAPSSDDWSDHYIAYNDKDGEILADWRCVQRSSNNRIESIFRCYSEVSGSAKENRITVGVNSDGSAYYWMSDAGAFRTALGLGSLATKSSITSSDISGSLTQNTSGSAGSAAKLTTARSLYVALGTAYDSSNPVTFDGSAAKALPVSGTLPINRGGTNMTQDYTNTIATGVVFRAWGHSAYLRVEVTKNFTDGYSAFTLGTIPSGYRPAAEVVTPATVYDTGRCCVIIVGTDGVIKAAQLGGSALGNHKLVGTASWVI